jgi:hypothetical protein
MERVEDGEVLGLVGIERSGKHNAIGNVSSEDLAGHGVAFDAAGGEGRGEVKEVKQV